MPRTKLGEQFAVFGLCVCGFAVLASVLRRHFGFPLDDSWIHQTVARNLVDYHVLGYLPGTHSSGSSSLLWTLILASQYKYLPFVHPVIFSAAVNGLLLGLTGVGLKIITERDGFSPVESWIFALAPALSGNFLWLGLLGMEHLPFAALSVLAIWIWFSEPESHSSATAAGAAILVGLLTLTRPEGLFLAGLLILFRRRAGRSWTHCLGLLLGAASAQLISFRVNWVASHTLLPLTMKGRQWLYFGGSPLGVSVRLWFVRRWVLQWLANWTVVDPAKVPRHHAELFWLTLSLLGAIALTVTIRRLYAAGRNRMCALLVWMFTLTLLYLIVLPATGHGGRYQPLQMLLIVPLLWIGFERSIRWLVVSLGGSVAGARTSAIAATFALIALATAFSYRHWRSLTADGIDQIGEEHGAMGTWAEQSIPADAVRHRQVAVFDIGRIGYGLHGSLIDLGGLTDPHYLPFLLHGQTPVYLKAHQVRYVILPTSPASPHSLAEKLLPHTGVAFQLKELQTFCFPLGRAQAVMDATGAALPCQTAYSLDFQ